MAIQEQETPTKKTPYEVISDLYGMPTSQIEYSTVRGDEKTFTLGDNSSISIARHTYNASNYLFTVNVGNMLSYQLNEAGMGSLIEVIHLPIGLRIGSFEQSIIATEPLRISREHREEIEELLTDWTDKSIRGNKITEPPFKINFPLSTQR